MKKLLTVFLAIAMIFSLCACAGSGNEGSGDAAALKIGYSKVDITPDFSVGLGGYSDSETRRSEGFVDKIYITCIAATSGEDTILIYTLDNCAAAETVANKIRGVASPATGVPENKIFVGATHAHSCPSLSTSDAAGSKYYQLMLDAAAKVATDAMADRATATMLVATPVLENMNFVRHYEMEDGTYAGSNFGSFSKNIVGHATDTDPQMVILKFDRPDDKKDVLMVNWQAHPDSGSEIGYTLIAPSWVGPMRDALAQQSGCEVAYFTGASGNQNKDSRIAAEMNGMDWRTYGQKLGEMAASHLGELKSVNSTGIKTTGMMFEAEVDHSWDNLLAEANAVYDLWKTSGKSAGDALGRQYGFTSSYQARAIKTRAAMGKSRQLEVNAFCIGDVGFTTGTYEMFSDQGLYVKEKSPFDVTFIITGNSGYLPSEPAYDYRSYEADTGMYAKGTAEKLAENYVNMLNTLK